MSESHFIVADDLGLNTVRVKGYSHVTLDLASGQAHAICAENRSGKTELLLTLAGRMIPTEGSLAIGGLDGTRLRTIGKIRRMAGLAFFEHVNEVESALTVYTVTSAELGLAGKRSNRAATQAYLAQWDLEEVADKRISDLDRYTYDLLGIALGMASDPKILAVSELERDLTEEQSCRLIDLLCEVAHERGVTVVCGVIDAELASRFDSITCLTSAARTEHAARMARRNFREVA